MGGKLERQKLQKHFAMGQHFRLPVVGESRRSALQWTKRSLVLCMIVEHLFLACLERWWEAGGKGRGHRQNAEHFKRTVRPYAWLNHSGGSGLEVSDRDSCLEENPR